MPPITVFVPAMVMLHGDHLKYLADRGMDLDNWIAYSQALDRDGMLFHGVLAEHFDTSDAD